MQRSPIDLHPSSLIQRMFMIIGFMLFIIFGIATASVTGSQEAAHDAADPQPELQVLSKLAPR